MAKKISTTQRYGVRTWLEINRQQARRNLASFRRLIGRDCQLLAVVKSNAYGHGLLDYTNLAVEFGADWLGLDSLVEAISLRQAKISLPLLVLGYTLPTRLSEARRHKISLTISSWPSLSAVAALSVSNRPNFHLKFDTGMSRQGFLPAEVRAVLDFLVQNNLTKQLEGVLTHLAGVAGGQLKFAQQQLAQFTNIQQTFLDANLKPLFHAVATAGALLLPEARLDMVRLGLGLYGLAPDPSLLPLYQKLGLAPLLIWKTIIAEIKNLPAGARVGYDGTEILRRDSQVAILPIGYWHGYPRSLSGQAVVQIGGRPAKVLGRVSMDMIAIDITDCPSAQVGQEVILLGGDHQPWSVDNVAALAGTVNYEMTTRLNPLLLKIIV